MLAQHSADERVFIGEGYVLVGSRSFSHSGSQMSVSRVFGFMIQVFMSRDKALGTDCSGPVFDNGRGYGE